jgi:hypothetical protein
VPALGTRACYLANGGASGRQFLDRFISLGWVVGVRIALLAIPLSLPLLKVAEIAPTMAQVGLDLFLLAFQVVYFWRTPRRRGNHVTPVPDGSLWPPSRRSRMAGYDVFTEVSALNLFRAWPAPVAPGGS